jgi:hypothetical protein
MAQCAAPPLMTWTNVQVEFHLDKVGFELEEIARAGW